MFNRKFLTIVFIASIALISSCKAGLLGADTPVNAPVEPIVVNGMRTSYADVVDKTSPAVVRIRAEIKETAPKQQGIEGNPLGGDDFFRQFQQRPPQNQRPKIDVGLGSGVIVNSDGTILTNNHVVDGAEKITVMTNDNKTFTAKVIGTDKLSDLAVIKIEGEGLPSLPLGNSDTVRIGDMVLAIGNPLGIGQTVTAGIISAKGRKTGLSDGSFEDFLQTDAPINRGNSGGALVNLNGELIGINSQILSPGGASGGNIGIGFSIPSNMAKSVMDQLLKDGKVHRGRLGIGLQDLSSDLAEALDMKNISGIIIGSVLKGSAADKAGLKQGDIITAVNGEKIEDGNVLRNKVAGTAPGTEIKLTISRDGKEQEFTATLEELNSDDLKKPASGQGDDDGTKPQNQGGKLGISLQPVTPQIAKQLDLESDSEGLVVTEIDPAGAAAEAGIARGDVILQVNKKKVNTVEEVKSALDGVTDKVALLVSRRGQTSYVLVRL